MEISYKKLWILLIEKNISPAALRKDLNIATGTMTKMRRNEDVALSAFCRVQRTPMRFRADAVQSTTDALKQCIFSYSRGFITTV